MPETELGIEDAGMTKFRGGLWLPRALSAVREMYIKQSHQRLSCMLTAAKKTPGFCGCLDDGIWPVGFKEGFFEIVIFNLTCEGRVGKVFLAEGTMHALK